MSSKEFMLKTGLKLLSSAKKSDKKGPKPHEPGDDPFYYEMVLYDRTGHEKLDSKGRPKTKTRPKDKKYYVEQLGIPKEDAKVLLKMKKRAKLMDGGGKILGIRIPLGLSTVLTFFFPIGGAVIDFAISNMMVQRSSTITNGLGKRNYSLMSANIVQDLLIGLIPFVGAIIDMFYRANTRNSNLLERMLLKRVKELKLEQEKPYASSGQMYSSDEEEMPPSQPARHGSQPVAKSRLWDDSRYQTRGKQPAATWGQNRNEHPNHAVSRTNTASSRPKRPGNSQENAHPTQRFVNFGDL